MVVAGLVLAGEVRAQDAKEARMAEARKMVDGLEFQSGEIKLGDGLATLRLPDDLRYLNPRDAATVLTGLWGNPPSDGGTLGMIVPKDADFLSSSAWAVIITYDKDGHVKDDDAAKIDYTTMLSDMQKAVKEGNAERVKEGYAPIELVGWAAAPKYDSVGKKLYWAKELKFGDDPEETLNYNIRILGREGVLVLNAVAASSDLAKIEAVTPELLSAVSFDPGKRYEDFNASTDKLAAYGLAALVAGGVAAKVGLFKGLWIALLAFKKFIVVGVIAIIAAVKKFFRGKAQ
jgi:uncharacterized membrane-anchored protein